MPRVQESPKKADDSPERAILVSNNAAAANGIWRNLGIGFGRAAPDAAAAGDYRAMLERVVKENPRGVGLITIIQSTSTPTPDGRDAMVKMFRDLWPHLRCAAFVVEARGFAAATQRAVLSAFLMATRLGGRLKIFATVEEATRWLAATLREEWDPYNTHDAALTMAEVVKEFCARYRTC